MSLTRRGRLFLLAAVAAWIVSAVGRLPVLAFATAVLTAAVVVGAATVLTARAIPRVSRRVLAKDVQAGDLVPVEIHVESGSRQDDTWVDRLPAGFTGGATGEGVRGGYRVRAGRRGAHTLGPLDVVRSDPFGLVRRTVRGEDRTPIVVLPRIIDIGQGLASGMEAAGDEFEASRASGVGEDDVIARPYVSGDELKRLHWKATARRGELMVRQEEQREHPRMLVVLDNEATAHGTESRPEGWTSSASMEWCVTIAASCVHHLTRDGYDVELLALGHTVMSTPAVAHGGRTDLPTQFLLAEIDPVADIDRRSLARAQGSAAIVLTGKLDEVAARALVANIDALHVTVHMESSRREALEILKIAGWTVVERRNSTLAVAS